MEGVVNGAFLCNNERTTELSDRMYQRNIPQQPVNMSFGPRPVPTRYVLMPMLDCRKPTEVPCLKFPQYNTNTEFSPGNSLPFDGYQKNIDTESKLRDIIFPMQKCVQSKFIPDTSSDLFNNSYLTQTSKPVTMTNQLLFSQEKFECFNPNTCNIGNNTFNNPTRVQVKDCKPNC
jgi:hypothetical protein|tara:strand:- start:446 stop:970 length:525 start_codon:yes stop_codon:yes gene_type:complete